MAIPMAAFDSHLIREQEIERERLQKENFNMKLRLNFLEEQLLNYKTGNAFENEDLEAELVQLRMAIEEKNEELENRNFLLVRARDAIEMLRVDLQQAKLQSNENEKHSVEEYEQYRKTISKLESQESGLKQEIDRLQVENRSISQDLQRLQVKYDELKNESKINGIEYDKKEDQINHYKHQIDILRQEQSLFGKKINQTTEQNAQNQQHVLEWKQKYQVLQTESELNSSNLTHQIEVLKHEKLNLIHQKDLLGEELESYLKQNENHITDSNLAKQKYQEHYQLKMEAIHTEIVKLKEAHSMEVERLKQDHKLIVQKLQEQVTQSQSFLQQYKERSKIELERIQQELSDIKHQKFKLELTQESVAAQNTNTGAKNQDLEMKVENLQKQFVQQTVELEKYQVELREKSNKVDDLLASVTEYKNQIVLESESNELLKQALEEQKLFVKEYETKVQILESTLESYTIDMKMGEKEWNNKLTEIQQHLQHENGMIVEKLNAKELECKAIQAEFAQFRNSMENEVELQKTNYRHDTEIMELKCTSLNEHKHQKELELNRLRDEIASLQKNNEEYSSKYQTEVQKATKYRQESMEVERTNFKLQELINSLQLKLNSLNADLKESQATITKLTTDYQTVQLERNRLVDEIKTVTNNGELLQKKAQAMQNQEQVLKLKISENENAFKSKLYESVNEIQTKSRLLAQLKEAFALKITQMDVNNKDKFDSFNKHIQLLQKRLELCSLNMSKLHENMQHLEKKNKLMEQKYEMKVQKLTLKQVEEQKQLLEKESQKEQLKYQSILNNAKQEYDLLFDRFKLKQEEYIQLKQEKNASIDIVKQLEFSLEVSKSNNSKLQSTIQTLEQKCDQLFEKVHSVQTFNDVLNEKKKYLVEELKHVQQQQLSTDGKNVKLIAENRQLLNAFDALKLKFKQLQHECYHLQQKYIDNQEQGHKTTVSNQKENMEMEKNVLNRMEIHAQSEIQINFFNKLIDTLDELVLKTTQLCQHSTRFHEKFQPLWSKTIFNNPNIDHDLHSQASTANQTCNETRKHCLKLLSANRVLCEDLNQLSKDVKLIVRDMKEINSTKPYSSKLELNISKYDNNKTTYSNYNDNNVVEQKSKVEEYGASPNHTHTEKVIRMPYSSHSQPLPATARILETYRESSNSLARLQKDLAKLSEQLT